MILLDTHALIWLTQGNPKFGKKARHLADKALLEDQLAIPAISFWEITMLEQRGRVTLSQPILHWRTHLLEQGLVELPITGDVGITAAALANFHADPADRLITATALHHNATLLTADKRILNWTGALSRRNATL